MSDLASTQAARRLTVAVISRVFSKTGGGAESYSVAITQQLALRHEVHVFAQETSRPVVGAVYHQVICLGRKPRWLNQLVFAIATWVKTRKGFDVVHSHENTWQGQIQTIHVRPLRYNLFNAQHGFRRLLRWLKVASSPRLMTYVLLEGARFTEAPSRKVVATSESLLQECRQAYASKNFDASIILPGTAMPADLPLRGDARAKLGIKAPGPCILFVANDYARKGLDGLLHALVLLPPDVELLVAGHPGAAPKYRQLAERLNLGARVHFLGSLDGLADAYCAADCLAHPTLEDSFAMVVLEAMAHGLPVVVSGPDHCGISRQLLDGKNALLLKNPKDSSALAGLLQRVLTEPELAHGLRDNGRQFAQLHSWEDAALQYEKLYFQVVEATGAEVRAHA